MPVTKASRASLGQNRTSSAGHGLWQQTRRAVLGGMSAVCSSRAQLAVWGQRHTVRWTAVRKWRAARQAEHWLERPKERSQRWDRLASHPQATAFPFIATECERDKRFPW